MKFDSSKLQKMTSEDLAYVEHFGTTTAWYILQQYGISRVQTSRAIKAGKLHAFMKGNAEGIFIKWYIVKDDLYFAFIEKYKKFDLSQE